MLLVIHYASLSGLPFFAKYVHVLNQSSAQKLNFVILKNIGGTLMMQTMVGLAVFLSSKNLFMIDDMLGHVCVKGIFVSLRVILCFTVAFPINISRL